MTAPTATTMLSAKRKRAQISYAEEDDELDTMLGLEAQEEDVDYEDVIDMTYGSHAKPKCKPAKRVKTSKKAKKEKHFPFMLLPGELRDRIYELALTDPSGIAVNAKTKNYRRTVTRIPPSNANGYRSRGRRWYRRYGMHQSQQSQSSQDQASEPNQLVPSLLAVSKAVHAEAIGWLYQQEIIVHDTYTLHSFLACIGSNRTRITDIVVRGWGDGRGAHKAMNYCAFTMLSTCTNLQSLFLDCDIHYYVSRPQQLARQIFREANVWLEAYGMMHGRKDAAVDILDVKESNFERASSFRNAQSPKKDKFEEEFEAELRLLLGARK